MKKIAIITTHPIQYNAPFFKMLAQRGKVQLKVYYTWPQAIDGFEDNDFEKSIRWDIPLLDGYDWEGVKNISKNPSSKNWKGIDCPDLINRINSFSPDVVMIYGWNLKSHFNAMRYFKGKVLVWFFGDSTLLDEMSGLRKAVRRIWLTWVYRHIDKAFYVGTNNKKYFLSHRIKEDQLVHYPHAIDNERFADNDKKQYEVKAVNWRKELRYDVDDKVILFAGKFESKKNPNMLVEAVQKINQTNSEDNKPIKLLLVGNGPLENELKKITMADSNIHMLPFQNQSIMPILYRVANVFCLPSQGPGETWGLAVNEAMACSIPVIASNKVGCVLDLIIDGKTGCIFKVNDLSDLYLKVKYFFATYDRCKNSGKSAFDHISKWSYLKKCKSIENNIVR